MADIDLDAIHWQVTTEGHLQPRMAPLPINYPDPANVAAGVVFGYENQFTGTLVAGDGSGSGVAPEITAAVAGDGQVVLTIAANAETDVIIVRHRQMPQSWAAAPATPSIVGSGDVTISGLTNGRPYEFAAYTVRPGLSDWSQPVFSTPTTGAAVTGPYAGAVEALRMMLANTTAWQTLCGVGDAESARGRTYFDSLPAVDGLANFNTTLVAARPCALVFADDKYQVDRIAVGSSGTFSTSGDLGIIMEFYPPQELAGDDALDAAYRWAMNQIDGVIRGLYAQSGQPGLISIRSVRMLGRPERSGKTEAQNQGDFFMAGFTVSYGV